MNLSLRDRGRVASVVYDVTGIEPSPRGIEVDGNRLLVEVFSGAELGLEAAQALADATGQAKAGDDIAECGLLPHTDAGQRVTIYVTINYPDGPLFRSV